MLCRWLLCSDFTLLSTKNSWMLCAVRSSVGRGDSGASPTMTCARCVVDPLSLTLHKFTSDVVAFIPLSSSYIYSERLDRIRYLSPARFPFESTDFYHRLPKLYSNQPLPLCRGRATASSPQCHSQLSTDSKVQMPGHLSAPP